MEGRRTAGRAGGVAGEKKGGGPGSWGGGVPGEGPSYLHQFRISRVNTKVRTIVRTIHRVLFLV